MFLNPVSLTIEVSNAQIVKKCKMVFVSICTIIQLSFTAICCLIKLHVPEWLWTINEIQFAMPCFCVVPLLLWLISRCLNVHTCCGPSQILEGPVELDNKNALWWCKQMDAKKMWLSAQKKLRQIEGKERFLWTKNDHVSTFILHTQRIWCNFWQQQLQHWSSSWFWCLLCWIFLFNWKVFQNQKKWPLWSFGSDADSLEKEMQWCERNIEPSNKKNEAEWIQKWEVSQQWKWLSDMWNINCHIDGIEVLCLRWKLCSSEIFCKKPA